LKDRIFYDNESDRKVEHVFFLQQCRS